MKPDTSTHKPRAIDPKQFRNLATGIGQTAYESEKTGARRAQRAADCTPPAQNAAIPVTEGRPTPGKPAADWTPAPAQQPVFPVTTVAGR